MITDIAISSINELALINKYHGENIVLTPEAFYKLAIVLCERYEQIKNDAQKGYGDE